MTPENDSGPVYGVEQMRANWPHPDHPFGFDHGKCWVCGYDYRISDETGNEDGHGSESDSSVASERRERTWPAPRTRRYAAPVVPIQLPPPAGRRALAAPTEDA